MSREVKFRFWSTVQSKMLDFMAIHFSNSSIIIKGSPPHEYPLEIPFDEGILMQYTGLKDKNGKEIYEGDVFVENILEAPVLFYVIFKDGMFQDDTEDGNEIRCDEIEVIGNIYEHPELLEQVKSQELL